MHSKSGHTRPGTGRERSLPELYFRIPHQNYIKFLILELLVS